ncbi:glycosyltransferase [Nitratifractor sp.]
MKKRLAILIYSLAPGGAERVVATLLPELMRHYEVTLVLMNETVFYEIPEGVRIVFLERSDPEENGIKKLLKLPLLAWKYRTLLRYERVDISLSFMNRPNYINVMAKIFGSGAKTAISERTAPSYLYAGSSFKDRVNRFLIRRLYPRADRIIPNSQWTREELIRMFSVPEVNIDVLYNPIDLEMIDRQKDVAIDREKRRFTFVALGRFERQKNHAMLIEAFHRADLDADLWLIGDGALRPDIERMVQRYGLEDRIGFLGRQKNPFAYLSKADCFVFSSDFEGFPNALLETLACGLPAVSTDCRSGPREILAPGTDSTAQCTGMEPAEYGILVPPGDTDELARAMERMYNDENLRRRYAQKSRQGVHRFEKTQIARELGGILKKLEDEPV